MLDKLNAKKAALVAQRDQAVANLNALVGAIAFCDEMIADAVVRFISNARRTTQMTKIWSLRHSICRGNHWVIERDCADDTVQAWLAIFRRDEPNVTFIAQARKPPIKKAA